MRLVPRFSLRTAAVLITLLCLVVAMFAIWHRSAVDQQRAVAAIEAAGGWVKIEESTGYPWLRERLGPHYFDRVTFASMGGQLVWIRKLPSMESLEITGPFDVEDVEHLKSHGGIASLSFRGHLVNTEAIEALSQIASIRKVDVSGRDLTEQCVAGLAKLPRLTELVYGYGELSSAKLRLLADCKSLRVLNLVGCEIDDLSPLSTSKGWPKLQELDLSHSKADNQSILAMKGNRTIERLNLASTQVGDRGVETLLSMQSLESLNLKHTGVTPVGLLYLSELKTLRRLELYLPQETEQYLAALSQMENVEEFVFDLGGIPVEAVDTLFKLRPDVRITINDLEFDEEKWCSTTDKQTQRTRKMIRDVFDSRTLWW